MFSSDVLNRHVRWVCLVYFTLNRPVLFMSLQTHLPSLCLIRYNCLVYFALHMPVLFISQYIYIYISCLCHVRSLLLVARQTPHSYRIPLVHNVLDLLIKSRQIHRFHFAVDIQLSCSFFAKQIALSRSSPTP